jgi:hypothetical protein
MVFCGLGPAGTRVGHSHAMEWKGSQNMFFFLGQFLPLGLKTDSKSGSYIDAVDMSRTNVCCQHVGVSTCFTRQHDITRLASRKNGHRLA